MKKLLSKLSNSGKIDVDSLREDSYSDEHVRKSTTLPSDARDTSQEIKLKKSFSGGASVGRDNDINKKKNSSSGMKSPKDKELKEKLNESDDKALRKSGSRKNSIKKGAEIKNQDSMKSPTLKGVFVSSYEHQKDSGFVDSDSSEDESVPRSRGNSMQDDGDDDDDDHEFNTTTPILVPSTPGRLASPVPLYSTPPLAALRVSPRGSESPAPFAPSSPYAMAHSPHASSFRPVVVPTSPTAGAQVPNVPRSVSSSPRVSQNVIAADDFDLRFGVVGRPRNDSITDDCETALGTDFARNQVDEEEGVDMIDDDDVETTNQKGKTGLFSSRKNKAKKLK